MWTNVMMSVSSVIHSRNVSFFSETNGEIFQILHDDNLHWVLHFHTSFGDFDLLPRSQGCQIGKTASCIFLVHVCSYPIRFRVWMVVSDNHVHGRSHAQNAFCAFLTLHLHTMQFQWLWLKFTVPAVAGRWNLNSLFFRQIISNKPVPGKKNMGELFPIILGQPCRWLHAPWMNCIFFSRSAACITGSPRATFYNHFYNILGLFQMLWFAIQRTSQITRTQRDECLS